MAIPPPPADPSMLGGASIPPPPADPGMLGLRDAVAQPKTTSIGSQIAEATANALPLAGMLTGAELSLPFAPAAGPLAPLVPVAGAAIGAMGGAGLKSIYQQTIGGQPTTSGQASQDILGSGKSAAQAQMTGAIISPAVVGAGNMVKGAAVRFGKQFAGIPETIGRFVQGQGPANVLTSENMAPGAAESAMESAQGFLSRMRSAASQGVKSAEDALIASGEANKSFDTTTMANELRSQMARSGITGSTSGLASGKGVSLLNEAQSLLDKGSLTGKELINVKRLLSDAVDYSGGRLPEISGLSEGLIKGVAGSARAATNVAYPTLNEANQTASQAFGVYDKYRNLMGARPNAPESIANADALRRIRLAFVKNPALAREMANDLGPVGDSLFNTIAAQYYAPHSPVLISPSSPVLKTLSTVGLTGPQIAGGALRASSVAAGAAESAVPLIPAGIYLTQGSALQQAYNNQR